jgi:Carboxypeptidase regulatory-like domain/WD domain, G-beta repeat
LSLDLGNRGAKLVDLDSGQLVHSFSAHTDNLWACVLTPDHRRLVTTSNDRTAKVWDVESGQLLHSLQHDSFVNGAAFSADGTTLVTRMMPMGLKVWDVATGTLLGADDSGSGNGSADTNVAFAGDRILAGGESTVVVYRELGRSRHIFHAPAGTWIVLASDDGTRVLVAKGEVGATDGVVTIWDTLRGEAVHHEPLSLPAAYSGNRTVTSLPVESPGAFELSEDARYLLVQRDGAQSEVWDTKRASVLMRWDALDTPLGLQTGGDRLVVLKAQMTEDAAVEVWTLDPPRASQRLKVGRTHLVGARFTRDRSRVTLLTNSASNSGPAVMTIFDTANGREVRTLHGFTAWGFDEQNEILAAATLRKVQLVRVADGSTLSEFPGAFTAMLSVAHDGDFVAGSEGLKSSIELIDATRRVLVELPFRNQYTYTAPNDQHRGGFLLDWRSVALSADGSRLLSAGTKELVTVDLTPEHRDPEAIARIVRERAPVKVNHGQLTPIAVEAARLRGRVTREGAPVSGATVIATKRDGTPATVVTNATGDYEFLDLAAGPIHLAAQNLDVGAFVRPRAMTLVSGDNRADLDLDLAGSISGRVVDESGQPVVGVHVHAECSGCAEGDLGDATTKADGSFELKALMGGGVYTLTALDIGIEEHLIPAAPGQAPIAVRDGNDHVKGVRFVVKRTR